MVARYPTHSPSTQNVVHEPQMVLPVVEPRLSDPSFTENRGVPIHGWVPWIAGFASTFVHDCIRTYLPQDGKSRAILDPFAGVGTTLVAARLDGHRSLGFEINPYAVLASRAKLEAMTVDVSKLQLAIDGYAHHSTNGGRTGQGNSPSEFFTRIPFFSPRIEAQVFAFLSYLATIIDEGVADLFKLAFGAVMVRFSNYTYEPSLCTRPGAGKALIEDAEVHDTILAKLRSMAADVVELQAGVSRCARKATWDVHHMSFMRALDVAQSGSVHLAVTSPPYMNNYHYVRSTRPQLYWLELLTKRSELRDLEEENVGKYWQTVRTREPVSLSYDDQDAQRLLTAIRESRIEKGPYGGPGWANYVACYLNDSFRFLEVLRDLMAPDGTAVIVIGNSIIQGHEVKVDEHLSAIGVRLGLKHAETIPLRTKRTGASITQSTVRRGETSTACLYECAVVLKKP